MNNNSSRAGLITNLPRTRVIHASSSFHKSNLARTVFCANWYVLTPLSLVTNDAQHGSLPRQAQKIQQTV